jgi:murein hydrolase activator
MKLLILLFIQLISINIYSQTNEKTELQKERDGIKKELNELEKQLKIVQGGKQITLAKANVIIDQMGTRQKLINNIGREVNYIDRDMTQKEREIQSLNAKLDTLKNAYAKSIVYAYKNRNNYNFLTFIFSSTSFNEALKRIQYLKSYRNYRARQAEDIKKYKDFLLGKTKELDTKKKEKSNVLGSQNNELKELAGHKNELDNTIKEINSKADIIGKAIAKQKKRQQMISSQIIAINRREEIARKKVVEEEKKERKRLADIATAKAKAEAKLLAKANADAAKVNTKPKTVTTPKVITPKAEPKPRVEEPLYTNAEVNANATFEQNRGRLPYPLQGSYISTHFGRQKLPGTNIDWNNEGTTFSTNSVGSSVVAVFTGVVSSISPDDGTYTVFIAHGRYKSVYANLSIASVSVGQTITTGQTIGRCAANEDGSGTGVLEFMMFRDSKIENPEKWIKR